MATSSRIVSLTVVLAVAVGSSHSGEEKDLQAIIARAIKAKIVEHNDVKYHGLAMKGAGTFYGLGEGIPFNGEWLLEVGKRSRIALEIKVMDQMLTLVQIINGDKGWLKFNDEVKTMPAEELAEEREDLHAQWVATLIPLKDRSYTLSALGEVKIGDKAAVGLRVAHKGKRDVNLFFDKASGILVKTENQVKDVKGGGDKAMAQETYFDDYKEFKGAKYPTKITIKREGKQYVEATISELRPLEKVDETMFARP